MKRVRVPLALAVLVFLLAGCSDKTESPENVAKTKARQALIAQHRSQDG